MENLKASELRIGNYIKPIGCYSFLKVTAKDIEYIEKNKNEYEGIPITEELLLEYGAKKRDFGFKITDYIRIIFDDSGFILECEDSFYSSNLNHIKYLHQLQNAIFALTGKELKKL